MIRHVVDWCDYAGLAWEGGDEWIVTSGRFSVLLVYTEYTEYMSWWWTVDRVADGLMRMDNPFLFWNFLERSDDRYVLCNRTVVVFCRGILRRER